MDLQNQSSGYPNGSPAGVMVKRSELDLTDQQFTFITQIIYDRVGIVLTPQKRDMVYGRLTRRLRELKMNDFNSYCNLLKSPQSEQEIHHLVNAITTNLTRFFREGHHLEHLNEHLKELAMQKQSRVRLWSAGCSSGMEPYSMAMVLQSVLKNSAISDAKILATDIDTKMLEIGNSGIYAASDIDEVPEPYRKSFKMTADGKCQMGSEIQNLIAFKQLNLLQKFPMKGPFDAIFCRNVVIYFDTQTKENIFRRMAQIIKPGGFLYIGHSESMKNISEFNLVGRTIYQRSFA